MRDIGRLLEKPVKKNLADLLYQPACTHITSKLIIMQAHSPALPDVPETRPYHRPMARRLSKPRPPQGARLAELRKAAGLTQTELAQLLGEPQPNIAFWEQSKKPPRSDVLPKMAKILGASVEQLLGADIAGDSKRRSGPVGKAQRVFERVSQLPRRQQDKIVQIVEALVDQFTKKAS